MQNLVLEIPTIGNEKRLPKVCGWTMLLKPVLVSSATQSGIIFDNETSEHYQQHMSIGLVVKQGPLCYTSARLGDEPWCKEGDLVAYAKHGGMKYKLADEEFIILNDDSIYAVLEPEMLKEMSFDLKVSDTIRGGK